MKLNDEYWMKKAIELAKTAGNTAAPNPRVGCVIVKNNVCIGQGYHEKYGEKHAEIHALEQACQNAGATLYVTLEPCSHTGNTPPCVNAIIHAKVARVVIGCLDPFLKQNNTGGVALLQAAGLSVKTDVCVLECEEVMRGFLTRLTQHKPWITLKIATSLNGAFSSVSNRWLTSESARNHSHQHLRARCDALLTTAQTIMEDNPKMTIRSTENNLNGLLFKQPVLGILDTHCRIQADAKVFEAERDVYVFCRNLPKKNTYNTRVFHIKTPVGLQGLDLKWIWNFLSQTRLINELLIECGPTLTHRLIQEGHLNELYHYCAPKYVFDGKMMLQQKNEYPNRLFCTKSVQRIGDDTLSIMQPINL